MTITRTQLKYPLRLTLLAGLLAAQFALAQPAAPVAIDIPAQPLSTALAKFAEQSGLKTLYAAELLAGKSAPRVQGQLSAAAALQQLLAGSGLRYAALGNDAVRIEAIPANDLPTTLRPISVRASESNDGAKGYLVPISGVGTKTNTELFVTPVFVNVVPGAVINESKAISLLDTLQFVAGITASVPFRNDNFLSIRGFSTSGVVLRDGLPAVTDWSFPTRYDMYNVERVEVLKGPASVLNGRSSPGGAVNIVTKQPQGDPTYSIEQRLGSFNLKRTAIDATGPLNEDKSLLYRVNAVYDDSNTFRDFGIQRRTGLDLSLAWRPSTATEVRVNVQDLKVKFQSEDGHFVSGRQIIDVPASRSWLDPRDPADEVKESRVGFDVTHKLGAQWTIRDRFGMTRRASIQDNMGLINGTTNPFRADGVTIDRSINGQWSKTELYANSLELVGDVNALGARHQTLVGLDYLRDFTKYSAASLFTTLATSQAAGLSLNIYDPTYGGFSSSIYDQELNALLNDTRSRSVFKTDNIGVYVQDLLTYGNNWHILIGGRWDVAKTGSAAATTTGLDFGPPTDALNAGGMRKDSAFSPRLGALYQPLTWLGVFANYSTGFHANQSVSSTQIFPPQKTKQVEAGLKAEFLEGNLSTSMTVFDLRKQNIRIVDPATPSAPFNYLLIGEQRSKGLEWALSGNITNRLGIFGNYTYIPKAWVSKDKTVAQGGQLGLSLAGVNRKQGSLWLSYNLPIEAQGAWTFGGGALFAHDRQGDATSTFDVPGYTRYDAFVAYKFKTDALKWTAQINIQNLLDKKHYVTASSRTAAIPGTPRAAVASLRLDY